jgi:hypothetical protein
LIRFSSRRILVFARDSLRFGLLNGSTLFGMMAKPRKDQDEKDLEKLAKKLLSMPHKPREESKIGPRKKSRPRRQGPIKRER